MKISIVIFFYKPHINYRITNIEHRQNDNEQKRDDETSNNQDHIIVEIGHQVVGIILHIGYSREKNFHIYFGNEINQNHQNHQEYPVDDEIIFEIMLSKSFKKSSRVGEVGA